MRTRRPLLIAFVLLVALPIAVQATIQQQRAQIQIAITLNVTPYVGYHPAPPIDRDAGGAAGILAFAHLHVTDRRKPHFVSEGLVFDTHDVVAQNQAPALVQAEVSPNPNGTLLYGNNCQGSGAACSAINITQAAGTTQLYSCVYQVIVDSKQPSWTLDSGLYTDFEPQGSGSGTIAGHYVAYNGYIATPKPTATPFIVYSDGTNWTTFAANSTAKTYCVDLTVTIPQSTVAGTYGSQAVYTLYY